MTPIRLLLWTLFMVLLSTSASSPAQTPGVPLTLQQAIALARAKNPNLLSGQQHVIATRASEVTAGLRQNPSLTLGGTDVTLPANNPGNPYSYSANLSRLFERGQKRRWRLDLAHSTTDVTQSQYQDAERQTIFAVKQAFTQMLAAKAGLKIADDNLQSYRKTVELSKQRLDAGDISATDFDRIELQLAEFEADYDNANLNLEQSGDQLKMLLGIDTPAPAPAPAFDIAGTLDPPQVTLTMADVEQRALAERPDYRAAQQSLRLAEANVKLAEAYGTTDPTLGGEYDRSGNDNSGGFQVNIPLRIFDRNQGEKERTRYEAQSTRFAEIAARNQVINDVDQAWAGYQTALRQSQRYNGHYLAQASRVRDNLEFSYRHGGSTLLDYLDALRDYRQVNLDALNANVQVWLGLHQLSYVAASEMVP
jgi:outer membrane protein, heavy metal efflux system